MFYHGAFTIWRPLTMPRPKEISFQSAAQVIQSTRNIRKWPFTLVLTGAAICPLHQVLHSQPPRISQVANSFPCKSMDSIIVVLSVIWNEDQWFRHGLPTGLAAIIRNDGMHCRLLMMPVGRLHLILVPASEVFGEVEDHAHHSSGKRLLRLHLLELVLLPLRAEEMGCQEAQLRPHLLQQCRPSALLIDKLLPENGFPIDEGWHRLPLLPLLIMTMFKKGHNVCVQLV